MSYVSDHPAITDLLGRHELLQEVGDRIKNCRPPHVVGVYGDWGSGKTSFLRSLQLYLSGVVDAVGLETDEAEAEAYKRIVNIPGARTHYPVVWFDAWRYQGEANPVIALLQEIRRQFTTGTKLANFIMKTSVTALNAALMNLEHLEKETGKAASGFPGNWKSERIAYEQKNNETALSSDQIRRQLGHAIKQILEAQGRDKYNQKYYRDRGMTVPTSISNPRLTVIIDDLDRCEAEMVERLLEGIKIYLNLDNCVFVLGVNSERLIDHIAAKYRSKEKGGNDRDCRHAAKDYLDKIVTAHYDLGLPDSLDDLIRSCFGDQPPMIGGISLTDHLNQVQDLKDHLPPNPRRIKMMMSTLARYQRWQGATPPDARLLVAFAYLNQFHPELVRKIRYYPGYAMSFRDWCKNPRPATVLGGGTADVKVESDFAGLLAPVHLSTGQTRFPDPIYDNVLHVQGLILKWALENEVADPYTSWKPYILLA